LNLRNRCGCSFNVNDGHPPLLRLVRALDPSTHDPCGRMTKVWAQQRMDVFD
jgi:hypothetical protein